MTILDAALARRLLEAAVAIDTKPALSSAQVDDLMTLAASADEYGDPVYTDEGLNKAASVGWEIKSGLTSDQYDLGAGKGRTLDRSQWIAHCREMAGAYAPGRMSVAGSTRRRGGRGSIGVVTGLGADEVWWWPIARRPTTTPRSSAKKPRRSLPSNSMPTAIRWSGWSASATATAAGRKRKRWSSPGAASSTRPGLAGRSWGVAWSRRSARTRRSCRTTAPSVRRTRWSSTAGRSTSRRWSGAGSSACLPRSRWKRGDSMAVRINVSLNRFPEFARS